ncbi:MAG: lysine biosynthesis protein LysX, partial [Anaerolineae bacterium]
MAKIGLLCSRVRVEEKMILSTLRQRAVPFERLDPRALIVEPGAGAPGGYDAVLVRCLSHSRAFYLTRWLADLGVPA